MEAAGAVEVSESEAVTIETGETKLCAWRVAEGASWQQEMEQDCRAVSA